MPSKLEDPSKQNHSMPFPKTAQTASNARVLITCSQWCKPQLIYSKHTLSGNQITFLKRLLNDCMYVCGTIFQEVPLNDQHPDARVEEYVFTRENISYKSNIEIPYYTLQSCKICIRCGRLNGLEPANPKFYPQCNRCNGPPVKGTKKVFHKK